jgi:hypothetical protein
MFNTKIFVGRSFSSDIIDGAQRRFLSRCSSRELSNSSRRSWDDPSFARSAHSAYNSTSNE